MARYRATIDTPREREDVFAYISDFSTTQEWDPGVVEAERLNDAAVGEGTEFRLVAEFLGRKTALTYRIVEYDPPHAVTFRGENATVISNDRITFEAVDRGNADHIRRRAGAQGTAADRRPAPGAGVQPRRPPRAGRPQAQARSGAGWRAERR